MLRTRAALAVSSASEPSRREVHRRTLQVAEKVTYGRGKTVGVVHVIEVRCQKPRCDREHRHDQPPWPHKSEDDERAELGRDDVGGEFVNERQHPISEQNRDDGKPARMDYSGSETVALLSSFHPGRDCGSGAGRGWRPLPRKRPARRSSLVTQGRCSPFSQWRAIPKTPRLITSAKPCGESSPDRSSSRPRNKNKASHRSRSLSGSARKIQASRSRRKISKKSSAQDHVHQWAADPGDLVDPGGQGKKARPYPVDVHGSN